VRPETRYARTLDGVSIAYQTLGSGPFDLVWIPGWVSNVETAWEEPTLAHLFERLASFSRLILFDKRGTGLSDRVPDREMPSLETRMSDLTAVCDQIGATRTTLFGTSEGGAMAILFAATYPERTSGLILMGAFARRLRGADFPWGMTAAEHEYMLEQVRAGWGGPVGLDIRAPSRLGDQRFRDTWARYLRAGASPGAAVALMRMNAQIDVRDVLATVHVPTLVMHRVGDQTISIDVGRHLAAGIPGARMVELPGNDHIPWVGDTDRLIAEIEAFVTGESRAAPTNRVLATVLFTDIVNSTERAAVLGDADWAHLLEAHNARLREQLVRFGGREIDTAGDGFLATFDGPARAVRCALSAVEAMGTLGIAIRAGVHTGEIELVNDDVRGLAVHIGARIAAMAGPGEVLVSRTVRDLVVGSGLTFVDRGVHRLKGVPDEWQVLAASDGAEIHVTR
jgi:pimeloyl-ACP methyl ester carboxylesterase/class 3 adenylate cyclase